MLIYPMCLIASYYLPRELARINSNSIPTVFIHRLLLLCTLRDNSDTDNNTSSFRDKCRHSRLL